MEETAKAVREIIAGVAKRQPSDVSGSTKLAEDLGMKSISRIELAALLEVRFGVVIGNFEIRKPKTVDDITALISEKQNT
ncbi:MAG: phosphopantetheine-binding protein [Spirochaetota bacterium]